MHIIDIIVFCCLPAESWPSVVLSLRRKVPPRSSLLPEEVCPAGWWGCPFSPRMSAVSVIWDIRERPFREIGMHLYSVFLFLSPLICGSLLCAFYRSQDSISAYSFWKPFRSLGTYICFVLLSAHPDSTYRVYPVFVGVAHECIVGMAYPDHYCCNQCGYCALFHVGWHEGCHLDRGHTGNYSDRRCVGMYVYLLLICPEVRCRLSPSPWKMVNSAWEALEAV